MYKRQGKPLRVQGSFVSDEEREEVVRFIKQNSEAQYLSLIHISSAELVAYLRRLFADNGVVWQLSEMGKVDQGGGGTIAKFMACLLYTSPLAAHSRGADRGAHRPERRRKDHGLQLHHRRV